jgi:uncharacterized protein YjdB
MEQETKKRSRKKKVAATVAVVMAIAITIGGTYMVKDFDQHKTNAGWKDTPKYDATLVENFTADDDWEVADGAVTKQISVSNTGDASKGFGEVYVRIQLKEYLEIREMLTEHTPERYMINASNGKFIVFDSYAEAHDAYPDNVISAELTDAVSGVTGYFVQTKGGDDNGQYGRYIYTTYELEPEVDIEHVVGTERHDDEAYDEETHNAASNHECDYPVHPWTGTDLDNGIYAQGGAAEYIKWILGDDVILLSDWIDAGSQPVAKWIIDDRSEADGGTNWIYWGQLLQPGEQTSNFLEAMQLIKQPDGDFYYAIHAEMEALSLDEILRENDPEWVDIPEAIKNSYQEDSPKVILDFGSEPEPYTVTINAGESKNAPDFEVRPISLTDKTVTWMVNDPTVASINPTTGEVTGLTAGTATVTATATNGKTAEYQVNVIHDVTKYTVDYQIGSTAYKGVKEVTDPTADNAGTNFDHGSTDMETQSRVWRATVTGDNDAMNNSKWKVVSQTGTGDQATWDVVTGTTNYLHIPAGYNGTITVKVSDMYDADWDVQFDIVVEPRPILATGSNRLTAAVVGDTSDWIEVATYNDGEDDYSLIMRKNYLPATANYAVTHTFGGTTTNNYIGSNVQKHINEWYGTLANDSKLVMNAVTHNAISRLGTTYTNQGDGFSKPLSSTLAGQGTADTAFTLSSGEAIQFCSRYFYSQQGSWTISANDIKNNYELLDNPTQSPMWLRSPGNIPQNAAVLYSAGDVSNDTRSVSHYVRPALWVKSEIFD